jgi:NifU-like protein involved in Fe-S cluster formation
VADPEHSNSVLIVDGDAVLLGIEFERDNRKVFDTANPNKGCNSGTAPNKMTAKISINKALPAYYSIFGE